MCHYFYGFFKQSQAKFSIVVEGLDPSMDACQPFFLNLKYPKMSEALKASLSTAKSCKFALVCKCGIYHLCPILQLYFFVECFSSVNSIRLMFKEKGHLYWSHK